MKNTETAVVYAVTGKTYQHADSLRRLGFVYSKATGWTTTDATAAAKVNPTYLGRRAGRELSVKAIAPAAQAVCPACGTYCYGDCTEAGQ